MPLVSRLSEFHSPPSVPVVLVWCVLPNPSTTVLRIWVRYALSSRVERRLELLLQESSPKCPQGFFFYFLENPPAQSCCSIQGRACPLTQPTSLARPGTARVRAPHGPTLNSSQPAPTVSAVFTTLHPYSPPCDLKQPGLSWCSSSPVRQGRVPLTRLSPRSPAAGLAGGRGSGAAVALVPVLVPGTFLS